MQRRYSFITSILFIVVFLLWTDAYIVHAQTHTICFYEEVQGEIDNVTFSQTYVFTVTGQNTVTIEMEVLSGDLDPYLEVYSEATAQRLSVVTNIRLDGSKLAKIFNLQLTPGDYSIVASRVGSEQGISSGTYRLLLDIGGPETMEDLERLVSGGGNLFDGDTSVGYFLDSAPTDDNRDDLWYFTGSARERLTVIIESPNPMPNLMIVQLRPVDDVTSENPGNLPDPIAATFITSQEAGFQLRLGNVIIPQNGRYVISVKICRDAGNRCSDYNDDYDAQIRYTINLIGSGGQRPEIICTTPVSTIDLTTAPFDDLGVEQNTLILNNEPTAQGTISDDLPVNYFAFAAQANDLVTITLTRTSDDLIPLLGVQNMNRELLDRETADLSERRAVMNFLVPETGWYVVIVTREDIEDGITSGSYQLQFAGSSFVGESAAAPDIGVTATVIRAGQVADGEISNTTVTFYFLISLNRDEEITLTMRRTTGDLEPVVAVMDTDLSIIERGRPDLAGRTSTLTFTAPIRGWYVIAATRDNAEAGTSSGGFALQIE